MRLLIRIVAAIVAALLVLVIAVRVFFGGGRRLEDRTTAPVLPASTLETVVNLDYPPGNIAVSKTGRIFFTLHPDGRPPAKVLELIDGKPVPYPDEAFQRPLPGTPHFQSILSVRIDRQDRLWTLDYADYGQGQPRLLAFDLATNKLVQEYDFPSNVAGFLSMLNDLQIDPAGEKIYIAETSPIKQTPALIVYDTVKKSSRRLLEGHPSVAAGPFITQAPGRDMIIYGIYALRIGVDSIALDKRGEWLYYGSVNGDRMYRIATKDLNDESLGPAALAAKVQDFAAKTLSDGLTMDVADNIYLSDMEHSAILTLGPDRKLTTLLKDPRLRWPDGFSFAPDGWLYVTCSSLQHVLFVSTAHMRANAPYQIFRFKPGTAGVPGQ
ncbi:MAG TPA: L-dopachrome tautomerase-related protein [Candidatus Kryptonia bacterium]|nr:L-dopachrome tautomerase-related protein [Candidatus Kryptonia bacterium]